MKGIIHQIIHIWFNKCICTIWLFEILRILEIWEGVHQYLWKYRNVGVLELMQRHALQGGHSTILYIECLLRNAQQYTFQGTTTLSYDHNKLSILHLFGWFDFFDHIMYLCILISLCIEKLNNYNNSHKTIKFKI